MPDWLVGIIVIGGFFLFVGLVLRALMKKDEKRTQELKIFAHSKGLSFKEREDPLILKTPFQSLPVFNKGNRFQVYNFMQGKLDDMDVFICDYAYWTVYGSRSKSESDTTWQTLICLKLPKIKLPAFDITIRSGIASFTTYDFKQAIDLNGDPQFSNSYIVCAAPGADTEWVKKYVSKEVQSVLASMKELKMEAAEGCLMLTRQNSRIKLKDMDAFVSCALKTGKLFSSVSP